MFFAEAPFRMIHPAERRINLRQNRVYILRGLRQVGKTTILKKLIKNLITLEGVDWFFSIPRCLRRGVSLEKATYLFTDAFYTPAYEHRD